MNLEKIGIKQLFLLMYSFEIGSAVIFSLGAKAKQDAWLTVIVGMVFGVLLISIYTKLSEYYPGDSFIQIIQKCLGKYIAYPLCITYIFHFTYQAARVSRDFIELVISTILVGTPAVIIMSSFVAVIIYTLLGGIEVFGRMAEIVVPVALVIFIGAWIIVFASGVVDMKQLTPVLGSGIKNIWEEAFPFRTVFPFGELLVFSMIWPGVNDRRKVKNTGIVAVFAAGILLSVNIVCMISVLGPDLYGRLIYPLLSVVRMASVADFLERIDAVVILFMVAGGFFKVGVYIYGAAAATAHLFRLQSYHIVLIPLGLIVISLGQIMAKNFVQLDNIKNFTYPFVYLPLQFVIPSLLLVIAFCQKRLKPSMRLKDDSKSTGVNKSHEIE